MLQYFRINDPFRLAWILLILFIAQIPIWTGPEFVTQFQLKGFIIGEALNGGNTMYKDIYDSTGPLSAGFYWMYHNIFNNSLWADRILGTLIVFIQAAIVNAILNNLKVYNESSYISALVYSFLCLSFFTFSLLSPWMLSMPFVLMSIYFTIIHMNSKTKDDIYLIMAGLLMGTASLFYWTNSLYIIGIEVILVVSSATIFRRYLLFLFASILPIAIAYCYFFIFDASSEFFYQNSLSFFNIGSHFSVSKYGILIPVAIPLIMLFASFFKMVERASFNFNQAKVNTSMVLLLIIGLFATAFSDGKEPSKFIFLLFPMTYFICYLLLLIQRRFIAEIFFGVLSVSALLTNYNSYYQKGFMSEILNLNKLTAKHEPDNAPFENKKILVIGEDLSHYAKAKLSTPYLNWEISKPLFEELDYYDNQTNLYVNFKHHAPDLIIDEKGVFKNIQNTIPLIKKSYKLIEEGDISIYSKSASLKK
ncbi:DUF6427 family protein [Aureibacter tunicatorum]|uniref:Uncharacterized protein n=1 Tax=Aureibacter tunicatorum TaxID=866807 RepID=A0AAE4BP69_9BACT|nr:DUF6427 family protein [Aureibacter tunicatorum]MDR6237639.1 hypothetical protein [Aureibacter tunicatorum]BDD02674.1 hypothetical protein AUTU_01570 [Aureibacter tunicatorum]